MVDTGRIEELIAFRRTVPDNYPWLDRKFYTPMMEALGDDEAAVITFIESADGETKSRLHDLMEELWDKFPDDAMIVALKKLV